MASYIYQFKNDKGDTVEGFDRVGQSIMSHYNTLLGEQPGTWHSINLDVVNQGSTLTRDQQVDMCRDFTDSDIKNALFSIPSIKTPRPVALIVVSLSTHGITWGYLCALLLRNSSPRESCQVNSVKLGLCSFPRWNIPKMFLNLGPSPAVM